MISRRAKNAGLNELEIFDYFQIDTNLPKHKTDNYSSFDNDSGTPVNGNWISVSNSEVAMGTDIGFYSRKEQFKHWLIRLIEGKKKEKPKTKLISITDFFIRLSKSYNELTPIADIANYYEKALNQAKGMGQSALVEKLQDMIDVVRGEAHLIAMGLKKYVTEKQVIDFYEKVGEDKHLKLTWIKNFGRIIPEEIYKEKKEIDDRKIFDNYVILHYDPANNGEKLTKKQLEDKKDPILFGVIKNSRKLYFIADWKDDYCDLTLEDMFKELGGKVLEINNKNVKKYIDKITI